MVETTKAQKSTQTHLHTAEQNAPAEVSLWKDAECFEETDAIKNSKFTEAEIEKLFASLSDQEIKVRLVFAEALATGSRCARSGDDSVLRGVTSGIAWVVQNRWNHSQSTFGKTREVIFKKQQFRSSFGGCDVAERKALLCPTSVSPHGEKVWSEAKNAVLTAEQNKNNPIPATHHYFFPQHFRNSKNCQRWNGVRPDWAQPTAKVNPQSLGLDAETQCIEFYKVP